MAGLVVIPASSGVGSTQALTGCPAQLGPACAGADLVIGTVCYGELPVQVGTIGIVTIDTDGAPSVECPIS